MGVLQVVDLTQVLITIIGTLVPVLLSLITLAYWLGGKFASIDERFARIDERFERIDERFKSIDKRFEEVNKRFEEVNRRFEEVKAYIDSRINRLAEANRAYQEFFIEYLSVKGLLRPLEASMLKGEIERFTRLSTMNPLTREEWEKIRRYLEKDELTLEEALELRRLARKVTDEYGDRIEAWKLHIYASIMVGWALRKKLEEEGKLEGGG
jgi:DNA repair exonuclease SbcCD ATPase subunit